MLPFRGFIWELGSGSRVARGFWVHFVLCVYIVCDWSRFGVFFMKINGVPMQNWRSRSVNMCVWVCLSVGALFTYEPIDERSFTQMLIRWWPSPVDRRILEAYDGLFLGKEGRCVIGRMHWSTIVCYLFDAKRIQACCPKQDQNEAARHQLYYWEAERRAANVIKFMLSSANPCASPTMLCARSRFV